MMADEVKVRATIAGDEPALATLYRSAFPGEDLLPLVRRLLREEPGVLSLAACGDDTVIGHVLFTLCGVGERDGCAALLGPLAVAPSRQTQGAGTILVREGLRRLARAGIAHVLVLGDPAYYGRFGFRPERCIAPPYALPKEWSAAWQSVNLEDGAEPLSGILRPPAAWQSPSLWLP